MRVSPKKSVRSAPAHRKLALEPTDVRERILLASRRLIEAEGLSALSMREVARRAGVSHQAPYNHFADREAILGALAEEGFAILRARLDAAREAETGDAVARAAACLSAYVEFACSHPAHFRLMFRPELVNLENCPGAREQGDRAFQCLPDAIRELVAAGLPGEPSEDALMALLWSTAHGLSCLLLDGPLSKRMPHAQRDVLVGGVVSAFSGMLSARMTEKPTRRKASRK